MCSAVKAELDRLPNSPSPTKATAVTIKKEPGLENEDKENDTSQRQPQRSKRGVEVEERFKRKFEWGSYYVKYNIPKSSTVSAFFNNVF